jgi:hypothetical protein
MIDFRTKHHVSQLPARRFFGVLALFGFFIAPTVSLPAQVAAILDEIPDRARAELLAQRSVSRTHTDAKELELAPRFPGVDEAIDDLRKIGTNIVSERLILVDGPVADEGIVTVFNALLAVSELSYLEYYNRENETWHDLFKESYRVDDEDDLNRQPDLQVQQIPPALEIPVLQGLPPFGDVLQTYRYGAVSHAGVDGFRFSSENEWDIRYRRIRVVKPGEMVTYAWVLRGDDYVLMYGIGAAKVFTGFGLFRDRIENSFTSRTDGLFNWLSDNYLDEL